MNDILIATANAGKVREITEIFAALPLRFTSLRDHWDEPPDIPETGATFLENARMKARWVYSRKNVWTLADDSGLEVDALKGEPGVLSARYAGEHANDSANITKLLAALSGVPASARSARFRCVAVLVGPGGEFVGEGTCEGAIGFGPRGNGGFGYDPLFTPDGFVKTFAELDPQQKHAVSHRGRALMSLKEKVYGLL
jgi:XTP/dITP diphosphohydrolase